MLSEKTLTGKLIENLTTTSKDIVIRTCDNCGKIENVEYRNIYQSRHKRQSEYDYCKECIKAICRITRKKGRCLESRGYVYSWDPVRNKQIVEHRIIIEKSIGRQLHEHERVHHIDGDKLNNQLENLFLFETQNQHAKTHGDLFKIAMELYKKNYLIFDKDIGTYYINQSKFIATDISLGFENIAIKQKKNICNSRLDVKTRSEVFKNVFLEIPMIASNMSTVINSDFCILLNKLGALGVLHRACSNEYVLEETKKVAKECDIVAVSVGIEQDQFDFTKELVKMGANVIFIDVAHGYSDAIIELGKKIKDHFGKEIKVVLGNTTNPNMFLECRGIADAIKCGIAQGFACETKNTAGCTEKQFSAILNCKINSLKTGIPIISDGAVREPADYTKALGAGANSIMAGKIFAACPESAAPEVELDGKIMKLYAGMASRFVQQKWKGGLKPGTCPEGGVRYLEIGEPVEKLLERYNGALKSGITYAGGADIKSFQENVEFVRL